MLAQQRYLDAFRALTAPAAARDPEALLTLAMWRLSGDLIRRDLAACRQLTGKAAAAGHPIAARIYANFLANGTGGSSDWSSAVALIEQLAARDPWASSQLAIIRQARITADGDPVEVASIEQLSERPWVGTVRKFFTTAECDYLAAESRPSLAPSLVIDPRTGQQVQNPVRTSDSTAFPFVQENPAIHALNRRIAAVTATDVRQGEPLQVLRYRPGQQFRPHVDAVTGDSNQRNLTVLVYLNEGYDGGETAFVRTGFRFKGSRGDALIFRNALASGEPDELAQHAGLPVAAGEKLIASRWIRERPFTVPAPPPLLSV